MLLWILPIQMFRTTAVLVIAAAIGFVVLRRQMAAETRVAPIAEVVSVPPDEDPAPPDAGSAD